MTDLATQQLAPWGNFYVIVGSSAGALTGLQFVVLTLIAQAGASRGRKDSISAFGTPNVVHFCAALLVASILSAPWGVMLHAGVAIAGCGVLGVVYSAIVLRRGRRQRGYQPVFEDWLWHTILPAFAYSTLFVAGAVLARNPVASLFAVGAASLLLVFIGIHNAWDTVTYVTIEGLPEREAEGGAGGGGEARGESDAAPDSGARSGAAGGAPVPSASRTPAASPGPGG